MSTDRLPPHSPESEQSVIGSILTSPQEVMGLCVERLAECGDEFYDLRHQTIYGACLELYEAGTPADLIAVQQKLKDAQTLEQCGGIAYLSVCQDVVPSAANITSWLDIVVEKYLLRKTIAVCTEAIRMVFEEPGDVNKLLDQVETDVLKVRASQCSKSDTPIKELVRQSIVDIEEEWKLQGKVSGIETGFLDFDKLTGGLQNTDMIVIAARPSMGKSSLAGNIVEHVALNLNLPVAVFSLEMSAKSLAKRMLCSRARVNTRNIRDGFLTERDFPKLTVAAGKIAKAPIFIDETPGLSVAQLRAKARRLHREHGIKLIVIDYLQLLTGSRRRYESRQQEVTEISKAVKNLAKELGVPIVVLCQLNRDVEKRKSARPIMSDLRESGAIEQDADIISFLYRPQSDQPEEASMAVNWYIAKQRNGPSGEDVPLIFLKGFTRFEMRSPISEEDLPGWKQPHND